MMHGVDLQFSTLSKGRIWLDALPEQERTGTCTSCHAIPATLGCRSSMRSAIEILLHHGGRSTYAMLGAEFRQTGGGVLQSSVRLIGDSSNVRFETPLTSEALWGITNEYGSAVCEGANECFAQHGAPPGEIEFCVGAHHFVYSNRLMFGVLAQTLAFAVTSKSRSLDEIRQFMLSAYDWRQRRAMTRLGLLPDEPP